MRGGQVTLFVIVGLVLLIVVGGLFMVLSKGAADKGSPIKGTTNVAVLSSFIGSCVDTVVTEQFQVLSRNGGAFSLEGYAVGPVRDQAMRYGLTRNYDTPDNEMLKPYGYLPPQYPDWNVFVTRSDLDTDGVRFDDFQDGYFGDVYFPAICSKTGGNRPGMTFTCRSYEGNPPGTPGPSTQAEFEARVRDGVRSCANLRAFQEAIGQDVERVDEPSVNITYTFSNVLVTLTYPVVLSGETTTRLEEFRRDYRVRYLPLAQFAIDLAREESRNVTFDLTEDYTHVRSYRPGFTVTANRDLVVEGDTPTYRATLVTIFDSQSLLDGQSYTFSFLIEHRDPMLSPLTVAQGEAITDDGMLPDGTPGAADPDETPIAITKERDAFGNLQRITVTDADGDTDWQEY